MQWSVVGGPWLVARTVLNSQFPNSQFMRRGTLRLRSHSTRGAKGVGIRGTGAVSRPQAQLSGLLPIITWILSLFLSFSVSKSSATPIAGIPSAISASLSAITAGSHSPRCSWATCMEMPDEAITPALPANSIGLPVELNFHSAERSVASINPMSAVESESLDTHRSKGISGNRLILATIRFCCSSLRLRGVFNFANSRLASAARSRASARCDSASAACCLADRISPSKESASRLAPLARPKAFDAEAVALSDWSLARFAAPSASVAEVLASPASLERSDTRSSLSFLISVSTLPAWTSMYSSPATPLATNPAPSNPSTNSNILGFSGGCTIPRRKSCSSSAYSQITKTTSSATPTTTRKVQKCSHPCSEERDSSSLSRLSSSVLRSDSFTEDLRDDQVLTAKIQLIAIVICFAVGIGIVLLMHFNQTAPLPNSRREIESSSSDDVRSTLRTTSGTTARTT
jgi:hypothetical protein